MPSENFKCKQCGNCCINLGDAFSTCATTEDIDLWEEEGRNDILEWVGFIPLGDEYVYDLWIDPQTDDDVNHCPWLKKHPTENKYICSIHDVKPNHCRAYPKSKRHAQETGCPGFDFE
jgi:Fe-S-cluster containining protein